MLPGLTLYPLLPDISNYSGSSSTSNCCCWQACHNFHLIFCQKWSLDHQYSTSSIISYSAVSTSFAGTMSGQNVPCSEQHKSVAITSSLLVTQATLPAIYMVGSRQQNNTSFRFVTYHSKGIKSVSDLSEGWNAHLN